MVKSSLERGANIAFYMFIIPGDLYAYTAVDGVEVNNHLIVSMVAQPVVDALLLYLDIEGHVLSLTNTGAGDISACTSIFYIIIKSCNKLEGLLIHHLGSLRGFLQMDIW